MLRYREIRLVCLSGKWSDALGAWGVSPSTVKKCPGTLLPLPMALSTAASSGRTVPNCAWPSARLVLLTEATVKSWIIHPSYHPLSLLMTNRPEMSVKTSMKALASLGSVGSPGLGSSTMRTAPTVGRPQLAPVAVNCTLSFTPGNIFVKTFGSKPVLSSK